MFDQSEPGRRLGMPPRRRHRVPQRRPGVGDLVEAQAREAEPQPGLARRRRVGRRRGLQQHELGQMERVDRFQHRRRQTGGPSGRRDGLGRPLQRHQRARQMDERRRVGRRRGGAGRKRLDSLPGTARRLQGDAVPKGGQRILRRQPPRLRQIGQALRAGLAAKQGHAAQPEQQRVRSRPGEQGHQQRRGGAIVAALEAGDGRLSLGRPAGRRGRRSFRRAARHGGPCIGRTERMTFMICLTAAQGSAMLCCFRSCVTGVAMQRPAGRRRAGRERGAAGGPWDTGPHDPSLLRRQDALTGRMLGSDGKPGAAG